MQISFKKNSHIFRVCLTVGLPLLLLLLFRAAGPFVYYNNDDLYRKMIVSGEISGSPSPYLIYGHFLLGAALSSLYRLLPAVPWYGIFSCGCVLLCMGVVLYRLLRHCRRFPGLLTVSVIFSFFAPFLFYRHLALLQYTVLAGLLGGCAIFWALTMDLETGNASGQIASIAMLCLLALLTYCIRDQVFFMMLPFAGLMWLGRFLADPSALSLKKAVRYGKPMGVLLLLLLVFLGIQKAAYSSHEWKDFLSFVDSSVTLYDYNGFPDYEENRALYDTLGISPESREAMASRYMILGNQDASSSGFAALAERSLELDSTAFTLSRAAALWIQSLSSYTDRAMRPVNLWLPLLYFGVLLLALLKKQWRVLPQPALLFLIRSALWVYILHQGRCPERISWTLVLVELFCLLGLLYPLWTKQTDVPQLKPYIRLLPLALLPLGLLICLRSAETLAETSQKAKAMLAFSANYEELKAYCNQRPNAHFLTDLYATAYYTEDMLSLETVKNQNTLSLGSWLTGSPLTDARLASWGIENAETALLDDSGLFVIFADTADFPADYFFRYYEAKYPGCAFTLTDSLKASQGITFLIYQGAR